MFSGWRSESSLMACLVRTPMPCRALPLPASSDTRRYPSGVQAALGGGPSVHNMLHSFSTSSYSDISWGESDADWKNLSDTADRTIAPHPHGY
jgi:hypothetical protein